MSVHAHDVLNMMAEQSYTEESLAVAITQKFGADALFHNCSQDNMSAEQLIAFLQKKGKFVPSEKEGQFTINQSRMCSHSDGHHHGHEKH